jgi:hypothetical protein
MSCTRASSSTTSGGNQEADPGFRTYAAWLGPGTWDLHPASGSALVDAGQPTLLDPDGSRSDVGALAGPYADPAAFTDADGDGLDAAWEEAHGLSDADASDAAEDADGDGATAAAEYAAGTDPTRADTDGDTSVDGDEAGAGTDPLDATFTPDAVVYAADSAAYLGTILAGGGDFDGDGAPDLAASGQYLGAALVVPGPFSGAVETSTSLITVALTPVAVALDGDITGDGLSDLLVARATTNGTLYVFEGGTSGTRTTTLAYATLTGNAAGDSMAATVAYADDVDGDGITDIFVGATGKDATASSAGGGYLVRSLGPGSSNVASVADLSVEGEAASDQAGASLDAGMDVDGDGIGDLLLGAPSNDGAASGGGAAYLVDGSLSGTALLSEATARTYGEFAGAGLGGSVALVGDTDGDGYGDWLVGAENRTTRGTILLFLGPSSGEIAPASADGTWYGEWDDAACGSAVARLDDLDGDARADWGLACQDYDSDAGMVAVVLGPGTGRHGVSDADARWRGDALDALGTTISRAGDTDGDGLDDAWFGAPRADEEGYTNNGAIQLLLGSTVP